MEDEFVLVIPASLSFSKRPLEQILEQLALAINSTKPVVALDFTKTTFVYGELSSLISSMISIFFDDGKKVRFRGMNRNVEEYFRKNGLLASLGIGLTGVDRFHTVIHHYRIKSDDKNSIRAYVENEIMNNISNLMTFDPESNDAINLQLSKIKPAIFEVVDNSKSHANSEYVYLSGQYYPKQKRVTIMIANTGNTIPGNISNKTDEIFDSSAEYINWATTLGNTTADTDTLKRGLGLYDIKSNLFETGEFGIVSGHGFWKMTSTGSIITEDLDAPFPGTLIHLTFLLKDNPLLKNIENKGYTNNDDDLSF